MNATLHLRLAQHNAGQPGSHPLSFGTLGKQDMAKTTPSYEQKKQDQARRDSNPHPKTENPLLYP
jgi:hypothetical protein